MSLDDFIREIEALKAIVEQLEAVPAADHERMLQYLWDRYVMRPRRHAIDTPTAEGR